MACRIIFVSGTDTGVGKTQLATLLTRHLVERGNRVAALKPICSGGRTDAHALCEAMNGTLTLGEVNPWYFRAPLSPRLAARREGRKVFLSDVLQHVRRMRQGIDVVLIEGAGGLLSPLGEDFDSRELIVRLRAIPIIVCPNRLGAVNQALLTLCALPPVFRGKAQIVLMDARRADAASSSNPDLLADLIGAKRIHLLPWLAARKPLCPNPRAERVLDRLLKACRG